MPTPYNLVNDFEGFYSFTTDLELTYLIYCIDSSEVFGLEKGHPCLLFQFGLSLETNTREIPNDPRVEATVVSFVAEKLSNKNNCIVYAGSPEGNKEILRVRLFDWWFIRGKEKSAGIEKYYRMTAQKNEAVLLICSEWRVQGRNCQSLPCLILHLPARHY